MNLTSSFLLLRALLRMEKCKQQLYNDSYIITEKIFSSILNVKDMFKWTQFSLRTPLFECYIVPREKGLVLQ